MSIFYSGGKSKDISQSRVIELPEGTGGIECVSLLLCHQIIQPVNVRAPL